MCVCVGGGGGGGGGVFQELTDCLEPCIVCQTHCKQLSIEVHTEAMKFNMMENTMNSPQTVIESIFGAHTSVAC